MQIVIDIPEDAYNYIKANGARIPYYKLTDAIKNGIPLPKGHGRLIDADDIKVIELEDSLHIIRHCKGDDVDVYIDAPTILEADKEEK